LPDDRILKGKVSLPAVDIPLCKTLECGVEEMSKRSSLISLGLVYYLIVIKVIIEAEAGGGVDRNFLSPFKECLIRLVNYQSLDLDWLRVPVVLDKYSVGWVHKGQLGWMKSAVYVNGSEVYVPKTPSQIPFNWNCLLQAYLFPPRRKSFYKVDFFGDQLIMPRTIDYFLPDLWDLSREEVFVQRSHAIFHLMVVPTVQKDVEWIKKWALGVYIKADIPFNRIAISVDSNFEILKACIVCQFCKRYEYSTIALELESMLYELESLQFAFGKVNEVNVGVPWLILDQQRPESDNYVSEIKSDSEMKYGLRSLSTETDINHVMFTLTVRNGSAWKEPYLEENIEYHRRYMFSPRIHFNERDNYQFFSLREESIKFLTCDGAIRETISFIGFISAFDISSWLVCLILWFLSIITYLAIYAVKRISLSEIRELRVLEAIENVGRILLEQGDILRGKYRKEVSILFLSGSWLLMGMVLSNAYKGNNIKELSAPRRLQLVHRFDQLYEKNFTLYMYPSSRLDGLYRGIQMSEMKIPADQKWRLKVTTNGRLGLTFGGDQSIIGDELEELVNGLRWRAFQEKNGSALKATFQRQIDKFVDLYNHVIQIPWEYYGGSRNETPFDVALSCNQSSYGDWTSKIQVMKIKMEQLKPDRHVVESTEGIVQKRMGWVMRKWFDGGILRRVSALVESGIVEEWKMLDLRLQKMKIRKEAKEEMSEDEPIVIGLEHNVSTVFYIFLVCVFVCMGVFGLENVKLLLNNLPYRIRLVFVLGVGRFLRFV
jgi:hypothetical protein